MVVAYRWHPLFGREVSVNKSYERQGVAMHRCHLDGYRGGRGFDLPQWMFDAHHCAAMRLVDRPQVSLASLQALHRLAVAVAGAKRVQAEHLQSLAQGDAHAVPFQTPVDPATVSVRTAPAASDVGGTALGDPADAAAVAGTTADRPSDDQAVGTDKEGGR